MTKKLIYYGFIRGSGRSFHGAKGPDANAGAMEFPGINKHVMEIIDGTFAPGTTKKQGLYLVSHVPPVMIVSWWDYSVDKRPRSNSNLIGMGFSNAEEMIDEAMQIFPEIMNRQPRPVALSDDRIKILTSAPECTNFAKSSNVTGEMPAIGPPDCPEAAPGQRDTQ